MPLKSGFIFFAQKRKKFTDLSLYIRRCYVVYSFVQFIQYYLSTPRPHILAAL
nr:MAG TPA: hypothetical protein [Caudoviricetes sp.]